jgi:hypothetical protein
MFSPKRAYIFILYLAHCLAEFFCAMGLALVDRPLGAAIFCKTLLDVSPVAGVTTGESVVTPNTREFHVLAGGLFVALRRIRQEEPYADSA